MASPKVKPKPATNKTGLKLNPLYNTSTILKAVADVFNTAGDAPKDKNKNKKKK